MGGSNTTAAVLHTTRALLWISSQAARAARRLADQFVEPVDARRRPSDPDADDPAPFVAFSELTVPEGGEPRLDAAFRNRLGAVERAPGFRGLEVWADQARPTEYSMVTWWDSRESFQQYLRSEDHRRSHDRIPTGPLGPRPRSFRRFRVVAR
ncbi:MAG: antibiotic biosynthesis monooxygenase [Acidimicrobiales bacterium]|nr:antibiotic biosynthesis monooxygenase [Acidimicrobiales bacterium]